MRLRLALIWLIGCILTAAPAFSAVTVFLTRHAERAGEMGEDPPLTPGGRERAELLARMLTDAGIREIFVTEYKRTQETAAPLARKLQIAPRQLAGKENGPLVKAIRGMKRGAALVVGHSNTLPAVIAALGGPAVKIEDDEYDNLFVLTISGKDVTLVRLRYGAGRPPVRVAGRTGDGFAAD